MPQALSVMELIATSIFVVAILHTFSTKFFAHLAHVQPAHAGFWHLLSEVEVVFGFWAFVFVLLVFFALGKTTAITYLETRNFTEPFFVFAIMVIAASRPILKAVELLVKTLARIIPTNRSLAFFFFCLFLLPLLGSFITEPAAMTLAALMLKEGFYRHGLSRQLKYATLAVLFVNVSIGGTLTNFAAPPVLMAADAWGWSSSYMLMHFGWKSALAVFFNALFVTWFFRKEITAKGKLPDVEKDQRVPMVVIAVHLAFLAGIVTFSHHPIVFLGLFLFFLGYTEAYSRYQDRLLLREALLVAFFLSGLVVLGGLQQWWLQPAISDVEPTAIFFLATGLTAITDNAALTYLASLIQGVSTEFKHAVMAGAVAGGGLTVIANAPNPAGLSILRSDFDDAAVSPLGLLLSAIPPTVVVICAFLFLG
ncbi:MAG: hypothetical protein FGM53_04645 [Rhodocyclaceae bacterium]|nr:hypothetical protein [Rhodocyclaceae bacterium]